MSQQFTRGDVVHIAKDLGDSMSHFENDRDAVILGSYRDQYGGGPSGEDHYTVMFLDTGGTCSWYYDHNLTLVRHGGESEIAGCEEAKRQRDAVESDLPWIVASWPRIREQPSGATMEALMSLLGIDNPWGRHGEGITYYRNVLMARAVLDEPLLTGDMAQVQARIADVRVILKRPVQDTP